MFNQKISPLSRPERGRSTIGDRYYAAIATIVKSILYIGFVLTHLWQGEVGDLILIVILHFNFIYI
ncbi:hypothetical protein [Microcoleus anatoxicus]|uniref:hypothetical protein n=1 Tax=Microcoleus anatoxicus TaxID=2705319 RepID=UPI0030C9627D